MKREGMAFRRREAWARRTAAWSAGGLLCLQLAWVLVMPPGTGIDEFDHAYRASAVAHGHWQPADERAPSVLGRGGFIPVRKDIVNAVGPACARLPYTSAFNCRPFKSLDHGMVLVASAADSYNPSFYLPIGLASRPFKGNAAIYVMRAAAMALCAVGFAAAVYITMLWSRTRWPLITLLLSCLPTTVYSTSVAAPNGLHLMGALLVWTSMAALVKGGDHLRSKAYVFLACGAVVVAMTHTLGVMWLGLIALCTMAYVGPRASFALLVPRAQEEWAALLVAGTGAALALGWLWYARPNDPSHPDFGIPGSPWPDIAVGLVLWPLQAVAAFPLRNEAAPTPLYAIALVVLGAVVGATVKALRSQPDVVRLVSLILVITISLPVVLTYVTFHQIGPAWQGRYSMPLAVGLFVAAALALDEAGPRPWRPAIVVGTACWTLAHLIGLLDVLHKQRSDTVLVHATGWWDPPRALIIVLAALASVAWLRALQTGTVERGDVRAMPVAVEP